MSQSTDPQSEFAQFLKHATAAPENFIEVWRYGLAMMMIDGRRASIVETYSDADTLHIVAITQQGDRFTVMRPAISEDTEQLLLERIRQIFDQDSW